MKKRFTISMPAFTIGFFIALLTFFILYQNSIITILRDNKLLPLPERFTELYLEDHSKLPSTVIGETVYPFQFTVHNLEYQTMEYPYTVIVDNKNGISQIDKGAFSLKHNGFHTIDETFQVASVSGRTKISIKLTNKNQEVHFWVNNYQE